MRFGDDRFRRTLAASLVTFLCAMFVSNAIGQTVGSLSPYFALELPTGPGPYPGVVMVSGCSGFQNERFSRSYDRDSNRLVNLGYAVIRVDYVRASGLDDACVGPQNPTGRTVSELEIAQYVRTTVSYLDQRADIDPERIYLMGSSLGGGGLLTAMSDPAWSKRDHIAAVINYFPVCQGMAPWTAETPMLLLLGGLDNIQPARYCIDLVQRSPRGNLIQVVEYSQAHHCFNAEDAPQVTENRSEPTCAYNPEASIASWHEIQRFLQVH
jgi:dienelactone hydrolase